MTHLRQFSDPRLEPGPQLGSLWGVSRVNAGGHAYEIDDWAGLQRFLVLGSEGGTYYVGERDLMRSNAEAVIRCIAADGPRTVQQIVDVSHAGRAPKNDYAIFALALAASLGDVTTRRAALGNLSAVCRTGTHLFTFATLVERHRGWGRALRNGVADWYTQKDPDALAYQLVKYRQRGGWTHRDLLRLSKPRPDRGSDTDVALAWAVGKETPAELPTAIHAFEVAQAATSPAATAAAIRRFGGKLPREALQTEHLNDPDVWHALLEQGMPMTALIRNLATMTRIGALKPMGEHVANVAGALNDELYLRRARVHPLAVLSALVTYQSGRSVRGDSTWEPIGQIVDALDAAFYKTFQHVEPTGKRTMLALDLSDSMTWSTIGGVPGITPRVGAAAMALVTAAVEPTSMVVGFAAGTDVWAAPTHPGRAFRHGIKELAISPRQRLDDVVSTIAASTAGGTDCALPMLYALDRGLEVDTFVIYTDNETWAGAIHPSQALALYRQRTGIDAKLVVVGMTSTGFSIADPADRGMLDVVGMDTATPSLISEFSAGRV